MGTEKLAPPRRRYEPTGIEIPSSDKEYFRVYYHVRKIKDREQELHQKGMTTGSPNHSREDI